MSVAIAMASHQLKRKYDFGVCIVLSGLPCRGSCCSLIIACELGDHESRCEEHERDLRFWGCLVWRR